MNNFIPNINKLNNDKSIDNKEDNYFNSLTTETFSRKEYNSDVINLSELNKEKLEYERDDVKMNNNNFGQPEANQAPAFGGRFFPSLEDEPTNMNMMGGLNNGPSIPMATATPEPMVVPTQPNVNNNLIDLTDLSVDNEQHNSINTNFGPAPTMPTMPEPIGMPSMEQPMSISTPMGTNEFSSQPNNSFEIPNVGTSPMPSIDSLQNNNPVVAPTTEPVSMDILNADFGAPQQMPAFGPAPTMQVMPEPMGMATSTMNMNMSQGSNFGGPIPAFDPVQQPMADMSQSVPNLGPNSTIPSMPESMVTPNPSMDMNMPQGGNIGAAMTIPSFDNNNPIPTFDNNMVTPNVEINTPSQKDVTPVTNTIKNLVNSLTEFGYKINVIEDDLINVSKLTIEIEK